MGFVSVETNLQYACTINNEAKVATAMICWMFVEQCKTNLPNFVKNFQNNLNSFKSTNEEQAAAIKLVSVRNNSSL